MTLSHIDKVLLSQGKKEKFEEWKVFDFMFSISLTLIYYNNVIERLARKTNKGVLDINTATESQN